MKNYKISLDKITTLKTDEELSKLNTKRLLGYYRAERFRRIRYRESWYTGWEYSYFIYKEDEWVIDILNEWGDYLNKIKEILNSREHVDRRTKQHH